LPTSVSREQEPETLSVWFRQRHRWVSGSNYLVRNYARRLLHARPRRIALELLYALSLYYIFFFAVITSDLLLFLSTSGVIRMTVPGRDALVCVFAFLMFVLQIVLALSCEHEDYLVNIPLALAMYFTYCQLWIPLVARAFYDDSAIHRPMKWAKTERLDVGNGSGLA
jgi:cellulose synthase/poly-beta-1,6-N-acetylglucosamine synthase-like glycosyltransferase